MKQPYTYMISDSDKVNRLMDRIITARPYQQEDSRTGVRASGIANCMRRTFYEITGSEPDIEQHIDDKSRFTMDIGTYFEDFITKKIQLAEGVTWKGKARVRHKLYPLTGETDQIVFFENNNVVIECKFTNSSSFVYKMREFARNVCDDRYYSQLQTYLWILPGIEYGIILIGNRDMKPRDELPPLIWKRVDRDLEWQELNSNRLGDLVSHLKNNTLPDREFTLNDNDCKWCPFKNTCWDMFPGDNDGGLR